MDDETRQLEAELTRLRPITPSRALVRRIETELATASVPRRTIPWFEWCLAAALPAAALIVLLLTQFPRAGDARVNSGATPNEPLSVAGGSFREGALKPVAAEKVLVSADDEGLVTLADGTQARRERLRYVDTITWKSPRTNASLTWTVPREEVRVVPVAFQ